MSTTPPTVGAVDLSRRWRTAAATAALVGIGVSGPIVLGAAVGQLRAHSGIATGAGNRLGWGAWALVGVGASLWLMIVATVLFELRQRDRPPKRWPLAPIALQRWLAETVERSVFGSGDLDGWTATRPDSDLSALVRPGPPPVVDEYDNDPKPDPQPSLEESTVSAQWPIAVTPLVENLEPFDGPTFDHVVERGDSLWGLAERYLADGTRWIEIVQANVGRRQSDGSPIDPGHDLLRGSTVAIPVALD